MTSEQQKKIDAERARRFTYEDDDLEFLEVEEPPPDPEPLPPAPPVEEPPKKEDDQ